MPISSITYPGRYSYAYGNIVYQVTSTAMSQYKFRFVFDVYMNSERIARLKVTPQNEDWGQIDIARVIQSYMDSDPRNMGKPDAASPISKAEWGWLEKDVLIYNVLIGEEFSTTPDGDPILYDGLGNIGDPVYDPAGDDRWVINGVKDWFDKTTDLSPFFLDTNPSSETNSETERFLTDSPRIRYVRPTDWGTLSALNFHTYPEWLVSEPIYGALYEFFDDNSGLISSGISYNVIYNGGWRYDCSGNTDTQIVYPDYYKKYISYVGAFPQNADYNVGIPDGTKYYRVSLVKSQEIQPPPSPQPSLTPFPTPSITSTPSTTPSSGTPPVSPAAPSFSPTPTPTVTPSVDLSCDPCNRYTIVNNDKDLTLSITWTDCNDGSTNGITLNTQTGYAVCSCNTPVRIAGSTDYDINFEGLCR